MNKSWGYFGLIASLSFIGIATISPFNFVVPHDFSWQFIGQEFKNVSDLKDYWQNILLFVPLGFSTSIIIASRQKQLGLILIFCLFISVVLSTSVELIQLLLPSRVSNFKDILCNSLGGMVGGVLFCQRISIIWFVYAILTRKIRHLDLKSILLSILTYCSIVGLMIATLLSSVNLSNWNDDYHLAIGNEVTGSRPWKGRIKSLYISDRGLNPSEVIESLEQPDYFFNQKFDVKVAFIFDRYRQEYQDNSQQLPDLLWQTVRDNNASDIKAIDRNRDLGFDNKSVAIDSQQWLKTKSPVTYLSKSLQNSNEFSLSLTVASNNIEQNGPARIIAISENIYAQNIILGQEKSDLYFRLRTPITGRNATNPEFIIPRVFSDRLFHTILITFHRHKLSFYIDRIQNNYSFTFNPYNSFSVFLPGNYQRWMVNLNNFSDIKCKIAFYAIFTIPLLLLITILAWKLNTPE